METLLVTAQTLGVAMGSLYKGRRFGWTTDEAKADALREAGASVVQCYNRTGPPGWEISASIYSLQPYHPPV